MADKINDKPLREAETNQDKQLLGFIKQEAERIDFGTLLIEVNIKNGKLSFVKTTEVSRTMIFNGNN